MRVTAQPAVARLVPLLLVMTWAAVTVTVTEPGVRSRIASAVTVAAAAWRAAARWARTPRSPAAWARAGSSEAAAIGRSRASQAAGDCRQDQESQAAVNRPARLAAACSRAGGNGSSEASGGRRCRRLRTGRGGGRARSCWPVPPGWRRCGQQGAAAARPGRRRPAARRRRPARAARLVIAVLAGAGLAGQGVPGGRGGLRRVPGQAAGRAARCLAVRAAVGRGGAGRGELGEPQPRAGAARRAARPPRPGRRGWCRGAAVATGTPGICAAEAASRMPGGGGPASRACSAASRRGLRSQNRTGVVMPVRAARAAYPASLAVTRRRARCRCRTRGRSRWRRAAGRGPARSSGRTRRGGPGRPRRRRSAVRTTSTSSACCPPLARAAAASAVKTPFAPVSWASRGDRAIAMARSRR